MAGMKRFVTYIYAYEDKKKGSNVGFAKIEIRGEDCRMEIHLRGVYARQSVCRVYLFREDAGDIEGVLIGEMKLGNGNGDFAVILKAGQIKDTSLGIGDMEGIFLMEGENRIFVSRWREGNALEVCRERFKEWQPAASKEGEPQSEREVAEDKGIKPEIKGAETQSKADPQKKEEALSGKRPMDVASSISPDETEGKASAVDDGTVHVTEIPMRNVFPAYDWLGIWENLKKSHKVFMPFQDQKAECIQIELKDLRELPKRYWYLGNNSFLLHGFFNYRYLVIGKTGEERWFIGVPGIYQRQERVMAAIFGFPEFIPTAAAEEERNEAGEPVNRFGCWYRYIEE